MMVLGYVPYGDKIEVGKWHKDCIPKGFIRCNVDEIPTKDDGFRYEKYKKVDGALVPDIKSVSLLNIKRFKADRIRLLNSILFMRDRHRDELELGIPTTLSQEEFLELLQYIQDLRDATKDMIMPDKLEWIED